ncbi:MAG TPA: ABC transporter ATP-binding protein [bacterium]
MPLTLQRLNKVYGTGVHAVRDLDLEIRDGEFFTLLGPSGCGKTTTLRMIAGLERPTSGRIFIGGRDFTDVPPRDRDLAMVFQNYALYPHMTVYNNLALNLQVRRVPRRAIDARVREVAEMLGIEQALRYKPGQLSGGQRQRVALGRALIRRPKVFLMDEPLSNLDLKLRERTRTELKKLHERLQITTVYVTHDQSEALVLSHRIGIMNGGALLQVGTPRQVYDRPADLFVAKFIGSPSINLLRVRLHTSQETSQLRLEGSRDGPGGFSVPIPPAARHALDGPGGQAILGARPEALALHRQQIPGALRTRVEFVEPMGAVNYVVLHLEEQAPAILDRDHLVAVVGAHEEFLHQTPVWVTVRSDRLVLFDAATEQARAFL